MAVLDFLLDWDIGTLILAAGVLSVAVLAGSFAMALGWRRWRDAQRRRRIAQRRGEAPAKPAARPGAATRLRGLGAAASARRGRRPAGPAAPEGPGGAGPEPGAPAAAAEGGARGPKAALSRLRRRS